MPTSTTGAATSAPASHLDRWGVNRYSAEITHGLSFAMRRAMAGVRVLPDFVIIGAGKGGTTSLYHYLAQHPGVRGAIAKEIHFLDHNYRLGTRWYRAHFPVHVATALGVPGARRHWITGEATPYYLASPHAPRRLRRLCDRAGREPAMIILLRNPVDRALSQYQMVREEYGLEPLSFEEALDAEAERLRGEEERMLADEDYFSLPHLFHSYVARGMYARQLRRWLGEFPRERFLILQSETFFAEPGRVFREVAAFLGLPPWTPPAFPPCNARGYEPMDARTRRKLRQVFDEPNREVFALIGQEFDWDD